jgi:hypothetical protein
MEEEEDYIKYTGRRVPIIDLVLTWVWNKYGYGKYPVDPDQKEKQLKTFWEYQKNFPIEKRILMYPLHVAIFKEKFKDATELDFLFQEIKNQNSNLEQAMHQYDEQTQIIIWIKRYIDFLENKQKNLLNPQESERDLKYKLCLPYNKTITIGIFIGLCDSITFGFKSDYALAKYLEKNVLYDNDKPLKDCMQEVSKYRNHERDNLKIENLLKEKFNKLKMRTNEDLV